jgi:hypothetical protein
LPELLGPKKRLMFESFFKSIDSKRRKPLILIDEYLRLFLNEVWRLMGGFEDFRFFAKGQPPCKESFRSSVLIITIIQKSQFIIFF